MRREYIAPAAPPRRQYAAAISYAPRWMRVMTNGWPTVSPSGRNRNAPVTPAYEWRWSSDVTYVRMARRGRGHPNNESGCAGAVASCNGREPLKTECRHSPRVPHPDTGVTRQRELWAGSAHRRNYASSRDFRSRALGTSGRGVSVVGHCVIGMGDAVRRYRPTKLRYRSSGVSDTLNGPAALVVSAVSANARSLGAYPMRRTSTS